MEAPAPLVQGDWLWLMGWVDGNDGSSVAQKKERHHAAMYHAATGMHTIRRSPFAFYSILATGLGARLWPTCGCREMVGRLQNDMISFDERNELM